MIVGRDSTQVIWKRKSRSRSGKVREGRPSSEDEICVLPERSGGVKGHQEPESRNKTLEKKDVSELLVSCEGQNSVSTQVRSNRYSELTRREDQDVSGPRRRSSSRSDLGRATTCRGRDFTPSPDL